MRKFKSHTYKIEHTDPQRAATSTDSYLLALKTCRPGSKIYSVTTYDTGEVESELVTIANRSTGGGMF